MNEVIQVKQSNALQFNPRDRSTTMTYDQLSRTMRIGDSTGKMPDQVPYQPGELIVFIRELIKTHSGLDIIEQPVVIREPYLQTNLNKTREGLPLEIEDYLVRRFVTRFDLPLTHCEDTNDHMNLSVALSYAYTDSVKGIQIAFGERVSVCDNLVAFGQYHFSTYGNSRVSFEDGMSLLKLWCQNLRTLHNKYGQVIEYLKEYDVSKSEFQRIIGSLFEKAVRANNGEKLIAPLNQSQVSQMVAAGLELLKNEQEGIATLNAWDLLSWGTSTLKAATSDMVELLKNTCSFNDFIYQEFHCDIAMEL